MKTHLILKSILVLCFLFVSVSIVNAGVGIYTPIGKPQITDISYSLKGVDENGLDLVVKNIGQESGSFQLAVSCNNNWEVYSYGGYTSNFRLASGDTENVRIPLSCNAGDSCYTSVNCEVSVEDTYGSFLTGEDLKDTRKIGFQAQHPSYCGTTTELCKDNGQRCEGKKLIKCSKYCDKWETEKICDYKCVYKEGDYKCLSEAEEKSEQRKNTLTGTGIIIAIIVVIVVVGWFIINKGRKKK